MNIQQQSSSSSSNPFIEHDVSTRKLGPSSGIRPSFLNRSIYTFLLLCLGVATHRLKLTKNSVVECKASENVCENLFMNISDPKLAVCEKN